MIRMAVNRVAEEIFLKFSKKSGFFSNIFGISEISKFRENLDFLENLQEIFFRDTNGGHPTHTTQLPRGPRIVNALFMSGKASQSVLSVANALFNFSERHFALKLAPKNREMPSPSSSWTQTTDTGEISIFRFSKNPILGF